jgi:probable HAF family extracellular repeat protein
MKITNRRMITLTRQEAGKVKRVRSIGLIAACCGVALGQALAQDQYNVTALDSLGGTSSAGNSVNNRGNTAGYSNLEGNTSRHAAVWRNDDSHTLVDLGTLGGPNSSVTWNVKNDRGLIAGIAQTGMPDPLGELWSSAFFYPGPDNAGFINRGFVWQNGKMRDLGTLGGNHSFAAGANNHNEVVGWAENNCHDDTCVPPQILQFRPVVWGPRIDQIRELPLISGDTSGAATAINNQRVAVGISGICDQAIGRYTAKHAVVWSSGGVTDIGNLGAEFWNTPTAINEEGVVVGFAGVPGFPEGDFLHAFIWTESDGIQPLDPLPGDLDSEAYGINSNGTVVGVSCDADGICRGVRWDDGVVTDLNDLKQPEFTDSIETAKDINDAGEITGRSISDAGVRTSYLAVPADE